MSTNIPYGEQQLAELFTRCCELHENQCYREAERSYRQLIALLPGTWLLHYNLGLLLFEENRFDEALSEYQKAVSLTSTSDDLFFNLAICQKACGLIDEAIRSYGKALALNPEDVDSYYNSAGCHAALARYDEACNLYHEVLTRRPEHQQALANLAGLLHKTGKKEPALACYTRLLQLNPHHETAGHMFAALSGLNRSAAPDGYIRDIFDHYSDHFEDSLVNKLGYTLPEQLSDLVKANFRAPDPTAVLDLGCGTGLTGAQFRDQVAQLHGVDLSAKMIEIARSKEIYDELFTCEIGSFLTQCSIDSYDLLLAADVFAYFGDLTAVLRAAERVCRLHGAFYFSVEDLPDTSSPGSKLRESGRFAHSGSYIKTVAQATGWRLDITRTIDLRKERGIWISGAIYGLSKVIPS